MAVGLVTMDSSAKTELGREPEAVPRISVKEEDDTYNQETDDEAAYQQETDDEDACHPAAPLKQNTSKQVTEGETVKVRHRRKKNRVEAMAEARKQQDVLSTL